MMRRLVSAHERAKTEALQFVNARTRICFVVAINSRLAARVRRKEEETARGTDQAYWERAVGNGKQSLGEGRNGGC